MISRSFHGLVLGLILFPMLTTAIDDVDSEQSLQPDRFMQSQVCEFPREVARHFIASGFDGPRFDPLCIECVETKRSCEVGYEALKAMDPAYPLSLEDYSRLCKIPGFDTMHPMTVKLTVNSIPRPANSFLHKTKTSRDQARARDRYSLDTHGFEWVYVNMDKHTDYRNAIVELRRLMKATPSPPKKFSSGKVEFEGQITEAAYNELELPQQKQYNELYTDKRKKAAEAADKPQLDYAKGTLFPAMHKIIAKAIGCKSMRLIDDLRYYKREPLGNSKRVVGKDDLKQYLQQKAVEDETARIRTGPGPLVLIEDEGTQPHGDDSKREIDNFRFPSGDESGGGGDNPTKTEIVKQEEQVVKKIGNEMEEALKKIIGEEEQELEEEEGGDYDIDAEVHDAGACLRHLAIEAASELEEISDEEINSQMTECIEFESIEFKDESEDELLEEKSNRNTEEKFFRFPSGEDDEEKKEDYEEKKEDRKAALADVGACKGGTATLPLLHVDTAHVSALEITRKLAKGKEVYFDSRWTRQKPDVKYREMYNVWVWLSEEFCTQPLGFDTRENGVEGEKHVYSADTREVDVVYSEMTAGDAVVFRTHDVAHTSLSISDTGDVCREKLRSPGGNCRMSVEFRVVGYGAENSCRGICNEKEPPPMAKAKWTPPKKKERRDIPIRERKVPLVEDVKENPVEDEEAGDLQ